MPPASNEYRDIESGRHDRSSHVRFYQQPPPTIIHHPDNNSLPTNSDVSSRTANDDRSARSNESRGSSVLRKQMLRLFRKSREGNQSEQERILQDSQDLKTAGTFDTTTSSMIDCDGPYEHPKSQSRMTKKWGKLKERMTTQAPELWMRSMESAQRMANAGINDDPINREQLIKQAQDSIRNLMEFSLWQCLLAILVYVSVSVYCFSYWLEDWTIVDSVYFAVVTFTTIGYGDVVPDTLRARIFTCFWALSGVACLGIALGVLGSQLIEVAEKEQKAAHDKHRTEVISMFNDDSSHHTRRQHYGRDDASTLGSHGVEDYYNDEDEDDERRRGCCSSCTCSPKAKRFFLLFTFLVMTLFGISMTEDWDVWSTLYYGLITASTVGYGDLSPATETGRILATLYIPIAVGVMGTLLDFVANAIIDSRRQKAQQYLQSKELTLRDLSVMDGDGDGSVTRAEFLEFMLVAMNQVDQELLDNLHDHFDRLDKDNSGTLDKADLINMAQKKLDSERKLDVRF